MLRVEIRGAGGCSLPAVSQRVIRTVKQGGVSKVIRLRGQTGRGGRVFPRIVGVIVVLATLMYSQDRSAFAAATPPSARHALNLARPDAAIELKGALLPYHAAGAADTDGSKWYITRIANPSLHPVTRVLLASESADALARLWPPQTPARILQVASSDGGISIVREHALGDHAFRVTIPAQTTAALALRILNADTPPSVLAWGEPALVAYHRRLAIFIAAIGGLIAAAAAITGGLAAMTGHVAARWAALSLLGVFLFWMAATGLLERAMIMPMGGPYGLIALIEGLTLLAAFKFVGAVAPYSDAWPEYGRYRRFAVGGLGGLSVLALVGVPGAAVTISALTVVGAAALSAYLVRRGAAGLQAARVLAPSAAVFALVELAAALAAFGFFHGNPLASKIIGGFAAAGAVLVALAVASGEGLGLFGAPSSRQRVRAVLAEPDDNAAMLQPLAAIAASHQGIYELDFPTDTLRLSADAATLLALPRQSLVVSHPSFLSRVHPDDRTIYKQALSDYRAHPERAFRIEFRARNESGRYGWLELRASMQGGAEQAMRCLGLIGDVTARKESEAASFDRSWRDVLTGLGNRVALMAAVERLGRRPRDSMLAMLDIDRFKSIHASLGDAGGDAVLRHVAERLVRRYASRAEIFRAGGDAFALLFSARGTEADQIGAELVELCGAALTENGRRIFAPASVGVARGADCVEPIDLISNSELALRLAKRAGGGCARIYSVDMDGSVPKDPVRLETELRRALEDGQIDLFYQPILHLPARTVAGFEALLRWHHPERGMIWPSDFIAHSEESGLIVGLGRFAIARAAEDLARWRAQFTTDPGLFVSVNVSRRQLVDAQLAQLVAEVLSRHQLPAGSLCLEITEGAIAGAGADLAVLERLKGAGAVLAIDDFGTGLSNLSQLGSLPFDALKIDRSFLVRGKTGKDADVILASIIRMAAELDRYVVVEGVEQEEEVEKLIQMGCRLVQGFLFSSAMPAAEVQNFVALRSGGRS